MVYEDEYMTYTHTRQNKNQSSDYLSYISTMIDSQST